MKQIALLILLTAGCHHSEGWGGAGGSSMYTTDNGTVHRGIGELTRHGQPYFVLLTAGGEVKQITGKPPGSGTVHTPDGRDIKWTCETPNGIVGKVVIDGQPFQLEKGQIFLTDLRNGKTVIEQLSVAPEFLAEGSDEQRLKSDERIARFFARTELPR